MMAPLAGAGVGAFFRRQEAAAAAAPWQILGILPTPGSSGGAFTLWALVGGSLYNVPLRVPRTVYLALCAPDPAADAGAAGAGRTRCVRTLPHGASNAHLYCATLSEADFRAEEGESTPLAPARPCLPRAAGTCDPWVCALFGSNDRTVPFACVAPPLSVLEKGSHAGGNC